MKAAEWIVLDISFASVLTEHPLLVFANFVAEWDEAHKYDYANSQVAQECSQSINKALHAFEPNFQFNLISEPFNASVELVHPNEATLEQRLLATQIVISTINCVKDDIEYSREKTVFERHAPTAPIRIQKVSMEEFVTRIQSSEKLWLLEATQNQHNAWSVTPSKVYRSHYGGARGDRLNERNQLTNFIGMPSMPTANGSWFWSVDEVSDVNRGGTYLADVVRRYGINGYTIIDDNVILDLQHNLVMNGGGCGYSAISPTTPQDYTKLKRFAQKHLSSFEKYLELS